MKRKTGVLPMILAGVALSAPVIASHQPAKFYNRSCMQVAWSLHDLISSNYGSPCVGDLDVAAVFVESAQIHLNHHKIEQALKSIDDAVKELREISHTRSYCAPLAPDVKRILAELIRARSEIETEAKLKQDNMS